MTFASTASYGQLCGVGVFTIEVTGKREAQYKLIPITPKEIDGQSNEIIDWIEKTFSPDEKFKIRSLFYIKFQVKNKIAERFLKRYKAENFKGFDNQLGTNRASDTSQNGIIQFVTGENVKELYLLKISSAGKTKYFIDNYLGACKSKQKIDLFRNR